MIDNIKSVLIGLTKEFGPEEASAALAYGLSLAQQSKAHVTVQAASVKLAVTGASVSDFAAGLVTAENRRLNALAVAAAQSAHADAAAAGVTCTAEAPELGYSELLESFTTQARLHDVTVLDSDPDTLGLDRGLIETMLIESGRPLLIVPLGCETFRMRRIIVAWDGSSRAARAIGDAMPFLRAAEAVEVVSVSGEKELSDTVAGAEIGPHLARQGINVTVNCIPADHGDVARTLLNRAALFEGDMIVMGGFVHSRLREFVFGGVTRALLDISKLPLLMSY